MHIISLDIFPIILHVKNFKNIITKSKNNSTTYRLPYMFVSEVAFTPASPPDRIETMDFSS